MRYFAEARLVHVLIVLIGYLVGSFSAAAWGRFKLLHVAPFAYAFAVYGIEVALGTLDASRWDMPVVEGCIFYGTGWLTMQSDRLQAIRNGRGR
jgi:hypothetical protein